MSTKIPCSECGTMILPQTFEKTQGYCMPCRNRKIFINKETDSDDEIEYEKSTEEMPGSNLTNEDIAKIFQLLSTYGIELNDEYLEDIEEGCGIEEIIGCVPENREICYIDITEPPGSWPSGDLLDEYCTSVIDTINSLANANRKLDKYYAVNDYEDDELMGDITIKFRYEEKNYKWEFCPYETEDVIDYYFEILEWGMKVLDKNIYIHIDENISAIYLPREIILEFGKMGYNNSLHLLGENIVFSGKMANGSRENYALTCEKHGANIQSSVNKKTTLLVVGDRPGASKLNKAKSINTKVITDSDFLEQYGLFMT